MRRVDLVAALAWMSLLILGRVIQGAEPSSPGWAQWRGPTFDGISIEAGLADEWPEAGPPVLWSRELGQGYSSFIAVGQYVYTLNQTLYEQAVVCLDGETGKTVWSSRYSWPYEGGGLYPGPRSTPTWYDERIYFAAPDGAIGCLNAADGQSIWSVNPTKQFHGQGTDFGYSCSPAVVDGKVIVPVGGEGASVVALDAKDGSVVWKGGDSSASYASPLPITLNGQQQVIALLENSMAAFDLKTGQLLWEDELSQGYDEHSAAPLYREPLLMIAGPFRSGAKCLRLQPDGKPTRVWDAPKFSNDTASSVLYEGHIYGFDLRDPQSRINRPSRGEYRCLDFETGKILWSTDQPGHANTIIADGKLILFNDRGEVILARASPERYEELARVQVFQDEICWSPAALDRGRLYLRTQTRAVCLYVGQQPLKSEQPVQTVATIPQAATFDPTSLLGGEREYPATPPEWSELGLWYEWSLGAIACAGVLAALVSFAVPSRSLPTGVAGEAGQVMMLGSACGGSWRRSVSPSVFWIWLVVSGLVGSPILNRWQSEYIFLWPLVLWAALQMTVLTIAWAERQSNRRRARWSSRLAGFAFLGVIALYFHLCRKLGLSIEWSFLTGLLPGFPAAALAAYEFLRPSRYRRLLDPFVAMASFSVYFGAGVLYIKWWLRVGS
ncbi:MAG TPA: PQQ-binding-like beta-propeller repeat protein [Schlesneria sp.]|jgi:outer membrane protein assembly factor BamB